MNRRIRGDEPEDSAPHPAILTHFYNCKLARESIASGRPSSRGHVLIVICSVPVESK